VAEYEGGVESSCGESLLLFVLGNSLPEFGGVYGETAFEIALIGALGGNFAVTVV
jgi:hypothetical protein